MANLLRNAVEAMRGASPGGASRLTISTAKAPNAMIEFVVADTGPGIAPELTERLFEPFVTTKPHGTGLGLAVSASIVSQHGGRLALDSTGPPGTVFSVRIPARAD
jgi:two-component system sensor kinase FixL